MSRLESGRRAVRFEPGYVERSRFYLWAYPRALASSRLRAFVYALPLSRLRTSMLGRLAQLIYRDWSNGKHDPVLGIADRGIEMEFFGLGKFTGHEGVKEAWADFRRSFGDARVEVAEVIDNRTGTIVLVGRAAGLVQATGRGIGQQAAIVWALEDGMIMRGSFHSTKADALKAAGLSE